MLEPEVQKRIVAQVAEQAGKQGCVVAPVGSVFFLYHDAGRGLTKDVDLVIHSDDLEVADMHTLKRIGEAMGEVDVSHDGAVVTVRLQEPDRGQRPEIELVRGRGRARRGYIPRKLLTEAARLAKRKDNIILYPEEFVLVMKADAAVDREERAKKNSVHAAENKARAEVFRGDVFYQTRRMLLARGVDRSLVESALSYLKQNRRQAVRSLLEEAGALA